MIIPNQKHLFTIPPDVTFLNCSYMSPLLKAANVAGTNAINARNQPWSLTVGDWFNPAEEVRELFAKIIQGDKENIALIPSASYGIAVAARNISLQANQKIIVLDQQYPSNVYAWRELSKESGAEIITIQKPDDETWTDAVLAKIDGQTGLVALPNCHWTNGSFVDLVQVSKKVKSVGASLVIDASQSCGAYPLNINEIKPDFLITVGYKWLLGAYGLSYLYADDKYCHTGQPIEYSWLNKKGSEDFTNLVNYRDEYKPGARRFDMGGSPNFISIQIAIAALKQIVEWGVENIQETISLLTDAIEYEALKLGLKVPKRNSRVGHMIGIQFPPGEIVELSKKLTAGKVFISFRGTSMRIAPHLYNGTEDIERLFEVINQSI